MPIAQKIKELLMPEARKTAIKDVRIGLIYTAVLLENDQAGVALTFREDMRRGCDIFTGLQPLAGRKASILNHTVDNILDAARSCRDIALLGASTPLLPDALAGTPTTILSGVVVSKPREILQIVSEGGGMRFFKKNVIKVNLPLRK